MELKGGILAWKLSLAESIAFATTIVTILLWVNATFQSKAEAEKFEKVVNARVERVESDTAAMNSRITNIAVDTSYIRGRLEPKAK